MQDIFSTHETVRFLDTSRGDTYLHMYMYIRIGWLRVCVSARDVELDFRSILRSHCFLTLLFLFSNLLFKFQTFLECNLIFLSGWTYNLDFIKVITTTRLKTGKELRPSKFRRVDLESLRSRLVQFS